MLGTPLETRAVSYGDGRAVGGYGRRGVVGGVHGCMQIVKANRVGGARGFAPVPHDAGW